MHHARDSENAPCALALPLVQSPNGFPMGPLALICVNSADLTDSSEKT